MGARLQNQSGMTLIELLVVILIVGVLSSIAIPTFLGQQTKGQDACSKSMAKQMHTAAETYFQDNSNGYVGMTVDHLSAIETSITSSGGCTTGTGTQTTGLTASATGCSGASTRNAFCVGSLSQTGNWFMIQQTDGRAVTKVCAVGSTGPGGCQAAGTW
jgi:type IV pilus assembly protein PilA